MRLTLFFWFIYIVTFLHVCTVQVTETQTKATRDETKIHVKHNANTGSNVRCMMIWCADCIYACVIITTRPRLLISQTIIPDEFGMLCTCVCIIELPYNCKLNKNKFKDQSKLIFRELSSPTLTCTCTALPNNAVGETLCCVSYKYIFYRLHCIGSLKSLCFSVQCNVLKSIKIFYEISTWIYTNTNKHRACTVIPVALSVKSTCISFFAICPLIFSQF